VVAEREWRGLVESIAGGDQRALRALYDRTHRIVFTLIMRITNSREIAEELTVDVFHGVWSRSAQFDPAGGSVVGWIMSLARSRAIDRVRFEQRQKRVAPVAERHAEPAAAAPPTDAVHAEQRRALLRAALAELTPEERAAIETAFFSELSYAETAVRLDAPVGTVKTRVRSALTKLRKCLGRDGGEP
jgi:RNA polymerase sigma-70 factor (ECF subfamily)